MSSNVYQRCRRHLRAVVVAAMLGALPTAALADCGNSAAGFAGWLERFKAKAAARGISDATLSALRGVSYSRRVIRLDRSQRSFKLSFKQFYARRVGTVLIRRGQVRMRRYRTILSRVEKRYGVPAPVLVAIWGLETNFGADTQGRYSILRSVATLAYDCRRSQFFTGQLMDALRVIERGDMTPRQLRGGWAGEIGQTQFLPSSYANYAVDGDGDGRRDLVRSVPDVLASTANFLKGHGWQRGQSWEPGSANYAVIREWNRASVYQRTISVMADRLHELTQASR